MDACVPNDPFMLLSFINTQLRDRFGDLDKCCDEYGIDRTQLEERLRGIDYQYDPELNKFV